MKKIRVSVCVVIVMLLLFPVVSFGADNDFSVKMEPPMHQIVGNKGHFNLLLPPGTEDKLLVRICNKSNQAEKYKLTVTDATTNINGIVDYTTDNPVFVNKEAVKVTDLVSKKEIDVTVDAASEQQIEIPIKMVNEQFDGIILGGVTIKKNSDETSSKYFLENVFWYSFAIQICQNEKKVSPNLSSNKAFFDQIDDRNVAMMEIENIAPVLLSHIKGTFTLREMKSGKVIKEESKEEMSIAPNTRFLLPVFLNQKVEAGEYVYELLLQKGSNNWYFKHSFTISRTKAKQLNQTSVDSSKKSMSYKGRILFLLFIVILVILIGNELYQKKKQNH